MSNLIKVVYGKNTDSFKLELTRIEVLRMCAIFLIKKYPELNGLPLAINLDYTKNTWRVSLEGIYPEDIGAPGNGKDNTAH